MSVPTLQTPPHSANTVPDAQPGPGHSADIPGHADAWHIGAPRLLAGLADGHRSLDARAHLSHARPDASRPICTACSPTSTPCS